MLKSIIQVFLLVLVTINISCNQTNRVENQLYDCFEAALSEEENKEVAQILVDFENHLIKRGVLESNRPASYLKIYETIHKTPK